MVLLKQSLNEILLRFDLQTLFKNIDSVENYKKQFSKMYTLYKEQKLSQLLSIMDEQGSEYAGHMDKLLDDRNIKWHEIIKKDLAEGKSFFMAVGAAHLTGTNGSIALLRKDGYTVTPLKVQ